MPCGVRWHAAKGRASIAARFRGLGEPGAQPAEQPAKLLDLDPRGCIPHARRSLRDLEIGSGQKLRHIARSRSNDALDARPGRERGAALILRLGLGAPGLGPAGAGTEIFAAIAEGIGQIGVAFAGQRNHLAGIVARRTRLIVQPGLHRAGRLAHLFFGEEASGPCRFVDRIIEAIAKPHADRAVAGARVGPQAIRIGLRWLWQGEGPTSSTAFCFSTIQPTRAFSSSISASSPRALPSSCWHPSMLASSAAYSQPACSISCLRASSWRSLLATLASTAVTLEGAGCCPVIASAGIWATQ